MLFIYWRFGLSGITLFSRYFQSRGSGFMTFKSSPGCQTFYHPGRQQSQNPSWIGGSNATSALSGTSGVFSFLPGPPDCRSAQLDTRRYGYASKGEDADKALLREITSFCKDLAHGCRSLYFAVVGLASVGTPTAMCVVAAKSLSILMTDFCTFSWVNCGHSEVKTMLSILGNGGKTGIVAGHNFVLRIKQTYREFL